MNDARRNRMCLEKEAYLSKDEAKRIAHYVRKQQGVNIRVYRCDNCRCWHLTSRKENG